MLISQMIAKAERWPASDVLTTALSVSVEGVYRALYARLAPTTSRLPGSAPDENTAISERGDGMLETSEWVWMVGADKDYRYHLLVEESAYVVTTYRLYDHQANNDPWVFNVRAPTAAALAQVTAVLAELLKL